MLSVRKNLTEILLEVTNEEIASLAKETLSKTRRKGRNKCEYILLDHILVVKCKIKEENAILLKCRTEKCKFSQVFPSIISYIETSKMKRHSI